MSDEEEQDNMDDEEVLEEDQEDEEEDADEVEADAGVLSVITTLKWVPRSFFLDRPITYELSKEEKMELEARTNRGQGRAVTEHAEGDDDQDEPEEQGDDGEMEDDDEDGLPVSQLQDMQLNAEKMEQAGDDDSDLGSDVDDHVFQPRDKILVTASVDDEQASLEIHTYDQDSGSFFVHHDIALPAYPLCVEWLGVKGRELGWTDTESQSYMAVGTFDPHIEIWSLDVLNPLEPNAKLEGHSDAVMCLAWNSAHPNLLASGSGDSTVRLWDLQKGECARAFDDVHKDKVQSCCWNPAEATVLLTGSFDRTVGVFDARDPSKVARYSVVESDVECVMWDPHSPAIFGVGSESGVVTFVDVRRGPSSPPLISFQAHESACSALVANVRVPGMYATCSDDKTIKLWDLKDVISGAPEAQTAAANAEGKKKKKSKKPSVPMTKKDPIAVKKVKVGKLFSCAFAANVEDSTNESGDVFLLAAAGSKGSVALWHAGNDDEDEEDANVLRTFKDRVLPQAKRWIAA